MSNFSLSNVQKSVTMTNFAWSNGQKSCTKKCPKGWSSATIDSKPQCLKDLGIPKQADQSAGQCKNIGGKLPLPLNMNENNDFQTEIMRLFPVMKTQHKTFVLDLSQGSKSFSRISCYHIFAHFIQKQTVIRYNCTQK